MLTTDKLLLAESRRVNRMGKLTPITTEDILSRLNDDARSKTRVLLPNVPDPTSGPVGSGNRVDN